MSKDVKLSNIIIITLTHHNDKYNYNRFRDNVVYNIFNLIFLLHHVKYWQWWNYYIQRSMRVHKINLYKYWTKEKNIHITFVIEPHFYFKNFSKSDDEILKMFKNIVVLSMTNFAEARSIEFFTSKILNIWESSFSTEIFFFYHHFSFIRRRHDFEIYWFLLLLFKFDIIIFFFICFACHCLVK